MSYNNKANFETLQSSAAAAIGASYAALGTPYTSRPVIITFKNNTNGDVIVSDDGVNDKLFFPAGSYTIYDIRTNSPNETDLTLPLNLQFYVKDGPTASTTGNFYIEAVTIRALP